jgi:hypothetical protein
MFARLQRVVKASELSGAEQGAMIKTVAYAG